MSLRSRLTLLYTTIVGGILLLFGLAVYYSVSLTVIHQVDDSITSWAETIYNNASFDANGQLEVNLRQLDIPEDVLVQVWGRRNRLITASQNIVIPLDAVAILSSTPVRSEVNRGGARLRILTVPLVAGKGNRIEGIVQVGTRMDVVNATQQTLLEVLLIGTLIAIIAAGFAAWFSGHQALHPLDNVTRTALQITSADDLSRRIPYSGSPNDEVGQLVAAFNQTLSRLENLFYTQRRFLADVGHELRTPLTVIKGNVGLMRKLKDFDEESLVTIEDEVDRLTRMVGDLLLLAQAESGKIPLVHELVELDTLLLEVLNQMRVLAHNRVELSLGNIDQVLVCGDRDRLKQVIVNLIGNAINYTPKGGEIVVGMGKVAERAQLTVTDNGPGIAPEDLPHIFERFYRGEKSRTRLKDGKGFGLGLSIAYWIIRNHGGRIEVNSTVGQGTTFCVWLPLATDECTHEGELPAFTG